MTPNKVNILAHKEVYFYLQQPQSTTDSKSGHKSLQAQYLQYELARTFGEIKLFSAPTTTCNNLKGHLLSQERIQKVQHYSSRNNNRSNSKEHSSMSFQDLGRRRGTGNKVKMQEPPKRSKFLPPATPTMSARPRPPAPAITTRCPVTSRSLLDDLSSFGDSQMPNQSLSCDVSEAPTAYDEDTMPPIVTPRENRTHSIFAQLTTEIANYQRMVSELESLLVPSSSNPEAQWRSRILIRSAKDADRDIWRRLYEYEANFGDGSNYSRAQIASRKLHRDFRRVHKHLIQFLGAHQLRQQVEVSFLSTSANAGEEKEEFFDRAMRERHAEVNQIHSSMHKVNEIYSVSLTYADIFRRY